MKICLDAGHYGKYNQSPCNKAYWESDFAWKFHLLLKAELEQYGIEVITTRPKQAGDLALTSRGKKAAGCDLFLSLHSNAIGSAPSATDYPLACCCVSGKCDVLGLSLAQTVERVMGTSQKARIIKKKNTAGNGDWYSVLYGAAQVGVPGILLEHSFHTNARATNWLLDDANLAKLAAEEAKTIAAYYGLSKPPQTPPAEQPAAPLPEGAFLIRVICAELNVRKGAGVEFPVTTKITKGYLFHIVETARAREGGTWGRLRSGAGWINIGGNYVKRV